MTILYFLNMLIHRYGRIIKCVQIFVSFSSNILKYFVTLVFFSFPDSLRIFRCLMIVNFQFSICLCKTILIYKENSLVTTIWASQLIGKFAILNYSFSGQIQEFQLVLASYIETAQKTNLSNSLVITSPECLMSNTKIVKVNLLNLVVFVFKYM